jgi:hypothetical protein
MAAGVPVFLVLTRGVQTSEPQRAIQPELSEAAAGQ